MSTAEQVMPVVLKPEDVPGAVLQQNLRIEDHSNFQLQRWLECRSLKKTGTKAELVQRVYDCINAGREEYIFLGIDNGKWYDVKRNLTHNIAASVPQTVSKWIKFPSRDIPKYFNKGHVYSYLVGNNFETEEFEITINETGITEKPFKRGAQFVGSDYIFDIFDASDNNKYLLKAKCFSSFRKKISYLVTITLNQFSGAVIGGQCECKQSSLGKCSHVSALLLFLVKFTDENGYEGVTSTSKLREWGLGAKNRTPGPVASKEYPVLRFQPIKRALFDPRPMHYTRSISINNFISDLQCHPELSMFQTLLKLRYEDFTITQEYIDIIEQQVIQFKENMKDYMDKYDSKVFEIKGAEIQGSSGTYRVKVHHVTNSSPVYAVKILERYEKANDNN
ncbi:hypothetical protein FQR65_LT05835 [Abscondita terminalis]|nr:hypothetical protein FQR65_LT05835 [Abscondita terminalis]